MVSFSAQPDDGTGRTGLQTQSVREPRAARKVRAGLSSLRSEDDLLQTGGAVRHSRSARSAQGLASSRGARASAHVYFWRRAVVTAALAMAIAGGWGALDKVLSSAVPSPAGSVTCSAQAASCAAAREPLIYVAKPGDTIWAIAVRFSGDKDPRPLEYRLEQQIGGGTLEPGQVLRLPPAT